MCSFILSLVVFFMAVSSVLSFTNPNAVKAPSTLPPCRRHYSFCRLAASKEDEIRELEERLQRLKEESAKEQQVTTNTEEEEEEEEVVALNEQAIYTELLTEQWKENEADASQEGGIMKSAAVVLATIGLLVGLALFSQVPVGQEDFSRYSTPTQATTNKIDLGDLNRARSVSDI
mmetsp:Transcript_31091/g.56344  ORF Transcript_31091/g.56344 Transcript_31091/m.56344 type:complete len:175 (+) Transcript_31091:53-577(+)